MKQVVEHVSEGSAVLNRPFNAFAGGEGGVTLHFPHGGIFKIADGNPKVMISENIKMFDQFFALIAGIATIHKQFRSANYTYFY
jgi:hypothetical protein